MRGLGVLTALLFSTAIARAADPPGPPGHADRVAAAAAFDDGVARFDRADYAAAARSFLKADQLAPSADALQNAIAAAQKANDQLLVVEAAERGVQRAAGNPDLATASREALADAARSLSRLDLSCQPSPCSLMLDGVATAPGNRYVLPGTHSASTVSLAVENAAPHEEQLDLAPGTSYVVALHAVAPEAATPGSTAAPAEPTERNRNRHDATESSAPEASPSAKPLTPPVFYAGVGVTVVLAGLTAWSGLDTLSAKHALSPHPPTADEDAVWSKARRSDVFLAGAVVVGGLTAASGFLWVDWGSRDGSGGSAALVPLEGGALATAQGRF